MVDEWQREAELFHSESCLDDPNGLGEPDDFEVAPADSSQSPDCGSEGETGQKRGEGLQRKIKFCVTDKEESDSGGETDSPEGSPILGSETGTGVK